MRRIWAYIILAATSLVLVGTTFTTAIKRADSNIEYSQGRELIFRLFEKDENGAAKIDENSAKEIADIMAARLNNVDMSMYQIDVQGDDTIRVVVGDDYYYSDIIEYMTFDGSFALTTSNSEYPNEHITAYGEDGSDGFLIEGESAYLSKVADVYPCVVLPVNVESEQYQVLYEHASDEHARAETNTDDEGNESSTYYLYLWYHYDPQNCTYDNYKNSESEYSKRMLMKFAVNSDVEQQYLDGENELYWIFNVGNGTVAEKESAYKTAELYVNLLNAEVLDYDIKCIKSDAFVDAWNEKLISYGDKSTVALSNTLLAILVSIVVICIFLALYCGISTIAIASITIVTGYLGFWFMLLLSGLFNTMAVIGIALISITSIVSGVIYVSKIKEEAYKGRSLKKANSEGGKKALLPIVDVNVVTIIIGVFTYVFGGTLLRSFSAIVVLGGLVSLILNTLGLKGMMWLATNATSVQSKYNLFGINPTKVPNILKEEKQTYIGDFADKDLTVHHKKYTIIGGILWVATLAAMIVFACLDGGEIYAKKEVSKNSNIYFDTTSEYDSINNEDEIVKYLGKVMVYDENVSDAKALTDKISGTPEKWPAYETTVEDDVNDVHYVYYVALNEYIDAETNAYYDANGNKAFDEGEISGKLAGVLDESFRSEYNESGKGTISLKAGQEYIKGQINVGRICLGVGIASAVIFIYLALRYRLSRGLAATIVSIATSTFAVGLFSLVHVPFDAYIIGALPVIAAFTFMLSIVFINREREMIIDDKKKDTSVEARDAIMVKATSSAYQTISNLIIFVFAVGIVSWAFGAIATRPIYLALTVGIVFALIFLPGTIGPIAQFFYARTHGVKLFKSRKGKKNNKRVKKPNHSAEPEEAVFIGIND